MNHMTLPRFWQCYHQLPQEIQALADKNYELLKVDSYYPCRFLPSFTAFKKSW